jgi:hypothetical protein
MMNALNHAAFSPLTAAADTPERRGEERQRTCFAIGRLVHAGREHVCLVRNMSESGVGIELDSPPPVGTDVTIETRALPPCRARVMWTDGRRAGLRLDGHHAQEAARDHRPRSPRFAFARELELIVEDRLCTVRSTDLSLGGIGLAAHVVAGVETPVVLLLGQHTLLGRLCWHAGGASGVRFTRPLTGTELNELLSWQHARAPDERERP